MRKTNTGKLVLSSIPQCQSFTWDRVSPPTELLELLANPVYQPYLLFPDADSHQLQPNLFSNSTKQPLFILLDSTWQEAKKMVRRSDWLKALPKIQLESTSQSSYSLRKNQSEGHLCTCETVAELLKQLGEEANAQELNQIYRHYLSVYQSDKSGHTHTPK